MTLGFNIDTDFAIRLLVGNTSYVLLIVAMMMTRMLWLRTFAIASGLSGAAYFFLWLNDPIGMTWELAFTAVNVFQVGLIVFRNMTIRLNDENARFYADVVPDLEPHQVGRIMKAGTWRDILAGAALMRQGEFVPSLIYLGSGTADVFVDGHSVARCGAGSLVGEISIASDRPATATVLAAEPARCLFLPRASLQALMKADPEIARAVQASLRKNLESKLVDTTRKVVEG
jgi:hypothetical protein